MANPAFRLLLLLLATTAFLISSLPSATFAGLQLEQPENPPPNPGTPDVGVGNAPPAPSTTPGMVSFTGGKGYYKRMAREFLQSHNQVRGSHGEAPFVWNKKLARYARRWSERLRSDCEVSHSMGPYGENMFWGTGWNWKASDAVHSWAGEQAFYSPTNNSCQPGHLCGHYTQIVWNDTVHVGCARVECYGGGVIISCNYEPPGNWVGEKPFN